MLAVLQRTRNTEDPALDLGDRPLIRGQHGIERVGKPAIVGRLRAIQAAML